MHLLHGFLFTVASHNIFVLCCFIVSCCCSSLSSFSNALGFSVLGSEIMLLVALLFVVSAAHAALLHALAQQHSFGGAQADQTHRP